jgi:hypothetical protein
MGNGHSHRALLLLALALPSCTWPQPMRSGGFTVEKNTTESAFAQVERRAALDLECPREKLETAVIDAAQEGGWGPSTARQIGVSGCGHEAVYVRMPDGTWVMNHESRRANARPDERP